MSSGRFININYPFKDSPKGFFLDLNEENNQAIKADLLHLLLTRKGQRLYNPDFGTDLLQYIYEPFDGITFESIRSEIENSVKTYLPQVNLDTLTVEESGLSEFAALVTIQFTITDDIFQSTEIITLNL
jgi:phage baseplate assembly protein W